MRCVLAAGASDAIDVDVSGLCVSEPPLGLRPAPYEGVLGGGSTAVLDEIVRIVEGRSVRAPLGWMERPAEG